MMRMSKILAFPSRHSFGRRDMEGDETTLLGISMPPEKLRSIARGSLREAILALDVAQMQMCFFIDKLSDQSTRQKLLEQSDNAASLIEVARLKTHAI